jgi:signal transduction histidine kinase
LAIASSKTVNLYRPHQSHPLPLLLYLEWVLLAIAIITELAPTPLYRVPRSAPIAFASTIGFSVMGLVPPRYIAAPIKSFIYVAIEGGLILLGILIGGIRLFPLLCLVLAMRSCVRFALPGRVAIACVSFGLFLVGLAQRLQNTVLPNIRNLGILTILQVSLTLLFLLSLTFVLLLVNALLAERQSRENLAIVNEQLRAYALRIEDQATLQERNRIARDIHDSLGHALTALNIQLETALKLGKTNPERAHSFLAEAKRLGSTALQEVRRSISTLRVDPLEGKTLEAAIESLTQGFQRATGIEPHCHIQLPFTLPMEVNIAIYRIVQESLTNICKYAIDPENIDALQVEILLKSLPSAIYLTIGDNGRGFHIDRNRTGFGLQGMRERAMALGGRFDLRSSVGNGCEISVQIPLSPTIG